MIKKVLLALDPDQDTPVATQYALAIARQHGASVSGLAVIDPEHIEDASVGGGIGAMYYAQELRKRLTERAREEAQRLIRNFQHAAESFGVRGIELVEEGVPLRRMIEDTKFHDLLVIGRNPHFYYDRPGHETDFIPEIVREGACPTLVVRDSYREVRRVLVLFDGSMASVRATQAFAQLQPFGTGIHIDLLHVVGDGHARNESELLLRLAGDYLSAHGFTASGTSTSGSIQQEVLAHAQRSAADLVVAGAYSHSGMRRLFFGSTARTLLDQVTVPVFLHA